MALNKATRVPYLLIVLGLSLAGFFTIFSSSAFKQSSYMVRWTNFGLNVKSDEINVADYEQPAEETRFTEQKFSRIYDQRVWGDDGNGSGGGSTLEYTKRTRALVEMMIFKYSIDVLVDAPCGAMAWLPNVIFRVGKDRPQFQYIGVDIVPSVIENNIQRFQNVSNMKFTVFDISTRPLTITKKTNGKSAIFSRDALQHLSFDLVISTLQNFARSNVDYIIIGSYPNVGRNANISTGDYFAIDLSSSPFSLPAPLEVIEEETPDKKHLVIYARRHWQQVDFNKMRTDAQKYFS